MVSVQALGTKQATKSHGSYLKVKLQSFNGNRIFSEKRDSSHRVVGLQIGSGVGSGQ